MKKRIHIIVLGGTITMTATADGRVAPSLDAEGLIKQIPQLSDLVSISTETLMLKPSASLTWEDIRLCYGAIDKAFAAGCDGIVILQGTDTLEEVAFIMDLLVDDPRPIVVSGAMRPASMPGSDGPANLVAAVSVAACDHALNLGTLVVMNHQIHAARYTIKTHTSAIGAFQSRLCGPLGYVHEGEPHILNRPISETPKFKLPNTPPPNVGLFPFAFDLHWPTSIMQEFDGVVLEAAGSGHVAGDDVKTLTELAANRPVVFSSRARNGSVMERTYGYSGSETELIKGGLIPAGEFGGAKARIVTLLALWNEQPVTADLFVLSES